ncbi:hypothetical protein JJB09_22825 [Rhizobium sp. KVB221]|uniref:Uncharacterized protein n=1 Tax=Rhizobium setariae TaxID=2801340 RepID=A0A936YVU4_9HYPH|nr:hypothetical protein [Rhizobium setariae]MBL0374851.1 hypothetical protein [Rhizobium setariae]
MVLALWVVIIGAFLGFFFWATSMVKQEADNECFDAGLAIVEFGRAYPREAIRSVIISADGEMVFLRLWSGRTGCMRRSGARHLCHLIDAAMVQVTPSSNGKGLVLDFPVSKALSGDFEFRTQKEAAEVSLWILGSLTAANDSHLKIPSHA